jgi:hypothetical protein
VERPEFYPVAPDYGPGIKTGKPSRAEWLLLGINVSKQKLQIYMHCMHIQLLDVVFQDLENQFIAVIATPYSSETFVLKQTRREIRISTVKHGI